LLSVVVASNPPHLGSKKSFIIPRFDVDSFPQLCYTFAAVNMEGMDDVMGFLAEIGRV